MIYHISEAATGIVKIINTISSYVLVQLTCKTNIDTSNISIATWKNIERILVVIPRIQIVVTYMI